MATDYIVAAAYIGVWAKATKTKAAEAKAAEAKAADTKAAETKAAEAKVTEAKTAKAKAAKESLIKAKQAKVIKVIAKTHRMEAKKILLMPLRRSGRPTPRKMFLTPSFNHVALNFTKSMVTFWVSKLSWRTWTVESTETKSTASKTSKMSKLYEKVVKRCKHSRTSCKAAAPPNKQAQPAHNRKGLKFSPKNGARTRKT
jgi:hypothetical protein